MSREVVVITGASSGIGKELAERFAADEAKLILVARSEDKLNELANDLKEKHGTDSTVIPLDLSKVDSAKVLYDKIQETEQQIDVLVNNAGFGQIGRFEEIPVERHINMCMLNMVTLTHLTRLVLPAMIERNQGKILNVGSTASFQPGPNSAVYYATKAYVLSLSEALYAELWDTNVSVTCLCPGPTETGFGADSEMGDLTFFDRMKMDVKPVAEAGYKALRKGKRLVIPGVFNNLLAWSNRITARPVVLWIMKRLQPQPPRK